MTEPLEINFSEFDEYIRQGEPDQKEKASIWSLAIGLQQVDQLQTSSFLRQTAKRNIEGEITIEQAGQAIHEYYIQKGQHDSVNEDEQEAYRVSANITKILSSKTFNFSTQGYVSVHRRIFEGVMKHAGELRTYDITKKEWVLQSDTVLYLNWEDLKAALDYDIERERGFSYKGLSQDQMIAHITQFVSGLWQIHAFREGNTRTTAVFTILYLRSLGWPVDLRSRYLYIAPPEQWQNQPQTSGETAKPSVQNEKTSVQILKLLRDNPTYTAAQMASLLGKSVRAIEMQLANLSKQHILRRVGANKNGHWEIIKSEY